MSREIDTAQVGTSSPRKVSLTRSLRREDSGYNSVIGTPAGTPCVMNGRKMSRAENRDAGLFDIAESCDQEVATPGTSCPAQHQYNGLPHGTAAAGISHQLSQPDEEKTARSAPTAYGSLSVPPLNRTLSLETGYYGYSSGSFQVSKRAEEIVNRFGKMKVNSSESIQTQSPLPMQQPEFSVQEVSQPVSSSSLLQRQFSEFPLDQTVLTVGQDGYYIADRDYNIINEAGSGGSACCNLGNDKVKNSQFVIKKPKKSHSEEEKQIMMRESRILKKINHSNVIRFYGAVEDLQDHSYSFKIFLEYANETCGDIHYLFCKSEDKDNFSGNIALIMLYVQQILAAVDYLHWERCILHLDIKGKNIVVCNGGYRVKLIDFGAACVASGPVSVNVWTPVFAAPEVNNQKETPKFSADVWSIMCVAVEMVTGNLPWPNETGHEMALFKVGNYEDNQITELVQYGGYWHKYDYHEQPRDMYQELVNMWKMVFQKDSFSRPSAKELLNFKWMREMELRGEQILHELVGGEEESCVEESQLVAENDVRIAINQAPIDYSSQDYMNNEHSMSEHSFSQPGHASPYLSTSPHLPPQGYSLSADHSPSSEPYYDCNNLFGSDAHLAESSYLHHHHHHHPGPSSLPPAIDSSGMVSSANFGYYSSTPVMRTVASQPSFAVDRSTDYTDSTDDGSSSSRVRSRSFSMQSNLPDIEQVTGKRKTSLCYIGSSKSEPTNVLNASGMASGNKPNVKRVNSLQYVTEGPKPDSPVNSPGIEQNIMQSLMPDKMELPPKQPRGRQSSSNMDTLTSSSTSSVMYSESRQSLKRYIKHATPSDHRTVHSSSQSSLPDRDEHKPDGCSEPSEATPHTIQLSSSTDSSKVQQVEVRGSTTVTELIKMTQHSEQSNSFIMKLDSTV